MSYLGQQLGQGQAERFVYTATGGETSVTNDDAGRAIAYTVGQVDVYLNGAKLINGSDFTATTGTSITGLAALTASDVVEVFALSIFQASDTVSASSGGTFNGNVTVDANLTVTGTVDIDTSLNVDGTVTADGADLDGAVVINESGADVDFRVESDSNTHALFVDAGNNRVGVGTSTPATALDVNGTVTATEITTSRLNVGANLAWNSSTDTYTANTTPSTVTKIHEGMKRCVLKDDGTVNYYLDPDDSTQKLDGTSANIDGTDGNVMVEIPRFYFRQVKNGNTTTWEISDVPLAGYQLHPAFFKNGEIVDYRYIGAYDACYLDATDSTYKSGLNLDDMTSNLDLANDKLASVSGVYPLVGVTRDECRDLASNVGTGWRQQDFWLTCAVQLLYLVEYGTFYSQNELGAGNTNGSYVGSSSNQSDSPHTVAGASNAWGNGSTDGTQPSAGAKPGTAYMSYRGIENFFGNCWNWVDGFNIGIVANHDAWVSNTDTDFADDTSTNYSDLGITMATANGYVQNIADVPGAFLPNDTTGASSSTYLTDYFFQNTGNRVARFGGNAALGAFAGAFFWAVSVSSSNATRDLGARLAY